MAYIPTIFCKGDLVDRVEVDEPCHFPIKENVMLKTSVSK